MRNKVQSNKVTKMDDAVFFRYSKQEDEEEEAEKNRPRQLKYQIFVCDFF